MAETSIAEGAAIAAEALRRILPQRLVLPTRLESLFSGELQQCMILGSQILTDSPPYDELYADLEDLNILFAPLQGNFAFSSVHIAKWLNREAIGTAEQILHSIRSAIGNPTPCLSTDEATMRIIEILGADELLSPLFIGKASNRDALHIMIEAHVYSRNYETALSLFVRRLLEEAHAASVTDRLLVKHLCIGDSSVTSQIGAAYWHTSFEDNGSLGGRQIDLGTMATHRHEVTSLIRSAMTSGFPIWLDMLIPRPLQTISGSVTELIRVRRHYRFSYISVSPDEEHSSMEEKGSLGDQVPLVVTQAPADAMLSGVFLSRDDAQRYLNIFLGRTLAQAGPHSHKKTITFKDAAEHFSYLRQRDSHLISRLLSRGELVAAARRSILALSTFAAAEGKQTNIAEGSPSHLVCQLSLLSAGEAQSVESLRGRLEVVAEAAQLISKLFDKESVSDETIASHLRHLSGAVFLVRSECLHVTIDSRSLTLESILPLITNQLTSLFVSPSYTKLYAEQLFLDGKPLLVPSSLFQLTQQLRQLTSVVAAIELDITAAVMQTLIGGDLRSYAWQSFEPSGLQTMRMPRSLLDQPCCVIDFLGYLDATQRAASRLNTAGITWQPIPISLPLYWQALLQTSPLDLTRDMARLTVGSLPQLIPETSKTLWDANAVLGEFSLTRLGGISFDALVQQERSRQAAPQAIANDLACMRYLNIAGIAPSIRAGFIAAFAANGTINGGNELNVFIRRIVIELHHQNVFHSQNASYLKGSVFHATQQLLLEPISDGAASLKLSSKRHDNVMPKLYGGNRLLCGLGSGAYSLFSTLWQLPSIIPRLDLSTGPNISCSLLSGISGACAYALSYCTIRSSPAEDSLGVDNWLPGRQFSISPGNTVKEITPSVFGAPLSLETVLLCECDNSTGFTDARYCFAQLLVAILRSMCAGESDTKPWLLSKVTIFRETAVRDDGSSNTGYSGLTALRELNIDDLIELAGEDGDARLSELSPTFQSSVMVELSGLVQRPLYDSEIPFSELSDLLRRSMQSCDISDISRLCEDSSLHRNIRQHLRREKAHFTYTPFSMRVWVLAGCSAEDVQTSFLGSRLGLARACHSTVWTCSESHNAVLQLANNAFDSAALLADCSSEMYNELSTSCDLQLDHTPSAGYLWSRAAVWCALTLHITYLTSLLSLSISASMQWYIQFVTAQHLSDTIPWQRRLTHPHDLNALGFTIATGLDFSFLTLATSPNCLELRGARAHGLELLSELRRIFGYEPFPPHLCTFSDLFPNLLRPIELPTAKKESNSNSSFTHANMYNNTSKIVISPLVENLSPPSPPPNAFFLAVDKWFAPKPFEEAISDPPPVVLEWSTSDYAVFLQRSFCTSQEKIQDILHTFCGVLQALYVCTITSDCAALHRDRSGGELFSLPPNNRVNPSYTRLSTDITSPSSGVSISKQMRLVEAIISSPFADRVVTCIEGLELTRKGDSTESTNENLITPTMGLVATMKLLNAARSAKKSNLANQLTQPAEEVIVQSVSVPDLDIAPPIEPIEQTHTDISQSTRPSTVSTYYSIPSSEHSTISTERSTGHESDVLLPLHQDRETVYNPIAKRPISRPKSATITSRVAVEPVHPYQHWTNSLARQPPSQGSVLHSLRSSYHTYIDGILHPSLLYPIASSFPTVPTVPQRPSPPQSPLSEQSFSLSQHPDQLVFS